jgi:hypothetical protein
MQASSSENPSSQFRGRNQKRSIVEKAIAHRLELDGRRAAHDGCRQLPRRGQGRDPRCPTSGPWARKGRRVPGGSGAGGRVTSHGRRLFGVGWLEMCGFRWLGMGMLRKCEKTWKEKEDVDVYKNRMHDSTSLGKGGNFSTRL